MICTLYTSWKDILKCNFLFIPDGNVWNTTHPLYRVKECTISLDILFLHVPPALHYNIIFWILSLPIFFKCPHHRNAVSSITSVMLCWTCIISIIFSYLDFPFALLQKFISVAHNVLAWCLPNVQISALYNLTLCTNNLKINILVLFTIFFSIFLLRSDNYNLFAS